MLKNRLISLLDKIGIQIITDEDSIESHAVPVSLARLCVNCDHIILSKTCPVCGSAHQLHLAVILGERKMPEIKCKACGKPIRWLRTEAGKLIPVDAETVDKADEYFDPERHVTHFITCPHAKQFRRKP